MWFSRSKPQQGPAFFAWNDREHSVGVNVFDAEHRHLAALMTRAHDFMQGSPDHAKAAELMENLIQETRTHFAHEERLLKSAGYPDAAAHAEEHAALLEEANDM